MEIKSVSYADILSAPNAQELLSAYAAECSIPEIGEPCPQVDAYAFLEASGVMRSFGVYKDETLVGFATVLVSILPHYGRKVATLESIFIAKEHRDGGAGRALMLAIEQYADEQECVAILYSAVTDSSFDKFLSHLPGYRPTNHVYCRRLN